jgi:hypothetical protein
MWFGGDPMVARVCFGGDPTMIQQFDNEKFKFK